MESRFSKKIESIQNYFEIKIDSLQKETEIALEEIKSKYDHKIKLLEAEAQVY